jgi:hypothetical protein
MGEAPEVDPADDPLVATCSPERWIREQPDSLVAAALDDELATLSQVRLLPRWRCRNW